MSERDIALLKDMLDAARKIQVFVNGKERDDLEAEDELRGFAVVKGIEIIGEAANHISAETREQMPSVEWGDIIGMRNRLIHAYTSINYDTYGTSQLLKCRISSRSLKPCSMLFPNFLQKDTYTWLGNWLPSPLAGIR